MEDRGLRDTMGSPKGHHLALATRDGGGAILVQVTLSRKLGATYGLLSNLRNIELRLPLLRDPSSLSAGDGYRFGFDF